MDYFEIKGRLKEVLRVKGETVNSLSLKTGFEQRKLNRQVNENTTVGYDVIHLIMDSLPDVDANWLITGEGAMLKSASETRVPANESALLEKIAIQDKTIEKLEIKIEKLETTLEKLIATNEKLATSNERLVNKIGRLSSTASTSFLDAVEDV